MTRAADIPTILEAMSEPDLWAPHFRGPSWDRWKVFLAALFGLPMTTEQVEIFRHHTGRTTPPSAPARECWCCCGRRSGKSAIAGAVSTYLSVFGDWSRFLAAGEVASSMTISPDRRQSRIVARFQKGLLKSVPMLAAMIEGETKDTIELSNRTVLEVMTSDPSTLRGYVSFVIINDEVCFLPCENSAQPDREILIAERPSLVSLPGSLLLSISSPYSRRGEMFEAHERHWARDGDPILFWKGTSLEMNPTLDQKIIAEAYERDALSAASEFGAEFRSDLERLISLEVLDSIEDADRPLILPYEGEEETEEVAP